MDREKMRNGETQSAVRILPADGVAAAADRPPETDRPPRRWLWPLVVVGVAVLAFLIATRPDPKPDAEAVATTLPPGLSAVSTELIDLTNPTGILPMTNAWEAVPFEWPGRINDVVLYNSSLFAIGYDDEGAAAWLSATGSGWRKVPRFEHPGDPASRIEHAVVWDGTVVALGSVDAEVGLWTARNLSHWVYQGTVAEMSGHTPIGLAVTDKLLAISTDEGDHTGWVSDDGLAWTQLDIVTLDEMVVLSLTGLGDWFYAAGQQPTSDGGQPVIYRSQNGVDWERVDGLDIAVAASAGTVADLTATPDGLIAVGEIDGAMAVWTSSTGESWRRSPTGSFSLAGNSVVLELRTVGAGGDALLAIGGSEHRVAAGSQILTDIGLLTVAGIGADNLRVEWADGSITEADLNSGPVAVRLLEAPISVAAQGPRIVIAGSVGVNDLGTPAVWTSVDGGATWDRDYTDPSVAGWTRAAVVVGGNITVVGGTDAATAKVWHSRWNTEAMEETGLRLVDAYFDAIGQRDIDAILGHLPAEPARFQLPGLAGVDLPWWDPETEEIDPAAVTDVVQYLEATDTSIALGECRPRVLLGAVDNVTIFCSFDVESDLLAAYSADEYGGSVEITIKDGGIQQVDLAGAPSRNMWQMLTAGIGLIDPATQALLDNPDTDRLDPAFTAESAPSHIRAAEQFKAGLLRPGGTRVVETSLGTMEWSWLDPLPLPVFTVNWIAHSADGFVAVGQGEPGRWTDQTTLWESSDGLVWEPLAGGPDVNGMYNLQPLGDGLLAQAWRQERSLLFYYDGDEWTEIEIGIADGGGDYYDFSYLATSGDTAMVFAAEWNEQGDGPVSHHAWRIGADRVARSVSLPTDIAWNDANIGIAGSEEGFVLAVTHYGAPGTLQVWFTADGDSWREIASTTTIANAAFLWNLQRHQDRYFVVGEAAETTCSADGDGVNCERLVGLWSSPDGADWDRVLTMSGEPVGAFEVGSGPLGLVALAVNFYNESQLPRPLFLSQDGTDWERVANLGLFHPDAQWWWGGRPAVGDKTMLIPGSAYNESSGVDSETPFLIVGRLLEP